MADIKLVNRTKSIDTYYLNFENDSEGIGGIYPIEKSNKKELKIGTKIEMEHTKSKSVATRIAKDHLREFPSYYTKGLIPMERRLKKMKEKVSKKPAKKKTSSRLGSRLKMPSFRL